MMTPLFPQGDNGGHMPFRAGERAVVVAVEGQRELEWKTSRRRDEERDGGVK